MRLVANWRAVFRYAWSIRLIAIAGLLSGLEVALPLAGEALPVPPGVFAGVSFIVTAAAFVARFVAQEGVSNDQPSQEG
ncbi:UNVERIFIED_ORG: hypothetical protein LHK14_18085 [Roseateles sp. XES5]|nr:hypothetical protein [Roseateles sp. XES5]